jgi:hypothetical protein
MSFPLSTGQGTRRASTNDVLPRPAALSLPKLDSRLGAALPVTMSRAALRRGAFCSSRNVRAVHGGANDAVRAAIQSG